jgi:hypothetical protein
MGQAEERHVGDRDRTYLASALYARFPTEKQPDAPIDVPLAGALDTWLAAFATKALLAGLRCGH